jgi:restriction endonuclease S subunit
MQKLKNLMLKVKLKEIAKINVGLAFRSTPKTSLNGNFSVIQMKDLGDDNIVNFENLIKINHKNPKEQYLAKQGDVIIRSRGLNKKVALVNQNCINIIVSAPLFIVKITSTEVLPEYLFFYLNQKPAQDYLIKCTKGSLVKMIGREDIEDLVIKIPDLNKQKLIGKLPIMINEEKALLNKIQFKRELYIKSLLQQKLFNLN